MLLARQKKFWWFLLAMGVGGTLIFAAVVIEYGSYPPEKGLWLWPVCTLAAASVAPFRLWRLYRREPAQHPGLFHLHLIDLLVATLLAGLAGTLCHWAHFVAGAVVLSPFIAVGFTLGVLVAARRGINSIDRKYLYAAAYLTYVFGLAGIAGWIVVIVATIPYGVTLNVLSETFFSGGLPPCWSLVMRFIRASLVALPAGWFVCRCIEKKR